MDPLNVNETVDFGIVAGEETSESAQDPISRNDTGGPQRQGKLI
jgi:hypothetical protein